MVPAALALGALAVAACGSGAPSTTGPHPAAVSASASRPSPVSVLAAKVRAMGMQVEIELRLRQPTGVDPPLARTARLDLSGVGAWRGGASPSCEPATARAHGPAGCPPASLLGHGHAIGAADTSKTTGNITIVNGGANRILLATTVSHPAYVKTVSVGTIQPRGDGVRIAISFPKELQVIAGVPVGLQELRLSLRRSAVLGARPCPSPEAWRYAASVGFEDGSTVRHGGAVGCPIS
jgi:hypothetical protein